MFQSYAIEKYVLFANPNFEKNRVGFEIGAE